MDPPPPYLPRASLSRSKTSRADLRASAEDLLRSSLANSSAMPLQAASSSLGITQEATKSPAGVPLVSSRSTKASVASSASLSRSNTKRAELRASADAMLRASLPQAPMPASASVASSASLSASRSSQVRPSIMPFPSLTGSTLSSSSISPGLKSTAQREPSSNRASTTSRLPVYPNVVDSITLTKLRLSSQGQPARSPLSERRGGGNLPISASRLSSAESKARLRKFQRDVDYTKSKTPPRSTTGLFRDACSVDLLFLIDTTNSMQPYIDAAKEQVQAIVAETKQAFLSEAQVRVAVVGYKDHADRPNIQFLDFTPDAAGVSRFLVTLIAVATHDNDWPEDVLGGVRQATNATWSQKTRCIIHIADAPPHGRNLHDLSDGSDHYIEPGSEPHGLTYEPLFKQLVRMHINYALLRINSTTDRMAYLFSTVYKGGNAEVKLHQSNLYRSHSKAGTGFGGSRETVKSAATAFLQFEELELGTSFDSLRHLVVKSVTSSVSRTVGRLSMTLTRLSNRSINTGKGTKSQAYLTAVNEDESEEEPVMVPVENVLPQWNTPGWLDKALAVEGFCPDLVMHGATTLDDMMAQDNIRPSFIQLDINVRSKPFSQGAMRTASYARTSASTDRFVVKSFKKMGKGFAELAEDMQCQAMCKAFALEFNALLDPKYSLDFVITAALTSKSSADIKDACISLEPYIDGTYIKYNNNSGYVNEDIPDDPFNHAAQAFSHFTFERSWGRFLVDDLQGVGNLLTDPGIQTKDENRFKLCDTNLHESGFKFFLATHKCNFLCRKLQLKSNGQMLESGNLQFREIWPSVKSTVYCSNKLCRRILHSAGAGKSDKFPGYYWCQSCFPQLDSSTIQLRCAEPGSVHEYDVSRFFYESQGEAPPLKCPDHLEADPTESRAAAVGGNLFERMRATNQSKYVSGRV
ncbi:hypothetical protein F5Y05DRAFT_393956 [Hypoxylon sp. FL0543]|nr:hypothetical protein F5Y05DRAFT_393956 [Hypoxylon sp. FL0543]